MEPPRSADELLASTLRTGDVVVFSSRVWHCSEPNSSSTDRRVFYAQFSRGVLGGAASPLGLAIRTHRAARMSRQSERRE